MAHPDPASALLADAKRWGLNAGRVQPAIDRLSEGQMSGSGSADHTGEPPVDLTALFEEAVADVVPQIGVRINAEDYERAADPGTGYAGTLKLMQEGLFWEVGLYLRPATVSPDPALAPGEFQLFFNDVVLPSARGLDHGTLLINTSADAARSRGLDARPAVNPANGNDAAIVPADREAALRADATLTVWNPAGYVVLAMSAAVLAHAGAFITARLTDLYMVQLRRVFPYLADALVERVDRLSLTRMLRLLLDEGISIRDLRTIGDAVLSVSGISSVDNTANIVFQLDTSVAYPASAMANPSGWTLPTSPSARACGSNGTSRTSTRAGKARSSSISWSQGSSADSPKPAGRCPKTRHASSWPPCARPSGTRRTSGRFRSS